MSNAQYRAPALEKGLSIIEALAGEEQPLSLVELGKLLGRSKSEIYRMVISLESLGWISKTDDDRFTLTNRLFDIAMRTPPHRNLNKAALPVMQSLSERLEQSCHIAVASGDDIVIVARIESPGLLGFSVRIGYRRPMIEASSGHLLYAFSNPERRKELSTAIQKTLGSEAVASLEQEEETIRARGILKRKSANIPGVVDLSVPLFDTYDSVAVAALTVPFLKSTEPKTSLKEAGDILINAGREISEALRLG